MATTGVVPEHIDYTDFDAVTLTRTGSFALDMSPDDALPLFTAPGEKLWVPGWAPAILNGDGYAVGTVWVTSAHGRTTYWYVAAYDVTKRLARYVRVTPDVATGTVTVQVSPDGQHRAHVQVTYQLTGLSESGNRDVEDMLEESAYAEMMEQWRSLLAAHRDSVDHAG